MKDYKMRNFTSAIKNKTKTGIEKIAPKMYRGNCTDGK
jgi:hypothetical protein